MLSHWEIYSTIHFKEITSSLTSKGEARVFLSNAPYLWVQEDAEVDALSHGGEGEEARRDADSDLWLIAAEAQLIQRLFCILRAQVQDFRHTGVQDGEKEGYSF